MKKYYKIIIVIALIVIFSQAIWQFFSAKNSFSHVYDETTLISKYIGGSEHLITPIPQKVDLNPKKVALGERLFSEPRLSNANVSCHSCHNLANAGIDGLALSIDINGGSDEMNTPTVFNSGFSFRQLWNGAAESLEIQIERVLHNKKHMGSSWHEVITRLNKDKTYRDEFNKIYTGGIRSENIKNALAVFVRSLITPNSTFDQYLRGDEQAISEDQKAGYLLFQQYGCIFCHQGVLVGGNVFTRYGVINDPFIGKKELTKTDMGRYIYTNDDSDKHVFKVPGLRNVARTAPYFHDGRIATLEDAIRVIAWNQLGREMPESDVRLITEFLKSLTGEYQGRPL